MPAADTRGAHGAGDPGPALSLELISKAFAPLPDPVLPPWLPKLITTLRDEARELVPVPGRHAAPPASRPPGPDR